MTTGDRCKLTLWAKKYDRDSNSSIRITVGGTTQTLQLGYTSFYMQFAVIFTASSTSSVVSILGSNDFSFICVDDVLVTVC